MVSDGTPPTNADRALGAAFLAFFVLDALIMLAFGAAITAIFVFDMARGFEWLALGLAVLLLIVATAAAAYASGFIRALKNKVNDNAR